MNPEIEERFLSLKNCQPYQLPNYSGVYFLYQWTTIVYVGKSKFSDRSQLFRTAHGLYALAIIANDVLYEGRTTLQEAAEGIAMIDWTWNNHDFRKNIGKMTPKGEWKLNTGAGSIAYLVGYCRPRCQIHLSVAA